MKDQAELVCLGVATRGAIRRKLRLVPVVVQFEAYGMRPSLRSSSSFMFWSFGASFNALRKSATAFL